MSKKSETGDLLALRITVVDPPPGISYALQLGKSELVAPTTSSKTRHSFDFTVAVVAGDSPHAFRLRGPAVQGKPGQRFVYLCVGAYAGQVGGPPGGRVKISLEGINRTLLDAVRSKQSGRLEAQFAGTSARGGPVFASVRLLGEGWRRNAHD